MLNERVLGTRTRTSGMSSLRGRFADHPCVRMKFDARTEMFSGTLSQAVVANMMVDVCIRPGRLLDALCSGHIGCGNQGVCPALPRQRSCKFHALTLSRYSSITRDKLAFGCHGQAESARKVHIKHESIHRRGL